MEYAKPVRIQRKRTKGFKLVSPNGLPCVYVGRPTKYGNPWKVGEQGVETNKEAVDLYEYHLNGRNLFPELKGKNLVCFCKLDEPCHADVLLKIVNKDLKK